MTKYITDIYALNIHFDEETCGDWHSNVLDNLEYSETDNFYGCTYYKTATLPNDLVVHNIWIANHYRALADRYKRLLDVNPDILIHEVEDYLDGKKDKFTEYLIQLGIKPDTFEKYRLLVGEIGSKNTDRL